MNSLYSLQRENLRSSALVKPPRKLYQYWPIVMQVSARKTQRTASTEVLSSLPTVNPEPIVPEFFIWKQNFAKIQHRRVQKLPSQVWLRDSQHFATRPRAFDLSRLTELPFFGVEQEHFVFHSGKRPPSHRTTECLWDLLIANSGFSTRCTNSTGMRLSIQRPSPYGPIVISNDSCSHIIEVSFPKMDSLDAFEELYQTTWHALEQQLLELELEIYLGSCIDDCSPRKSVGGQNSPHPHTIDLDDLDVINWRPKETDPEGVRLKKFLQRPGLESPLFAQSFPACFTATHINFDLDAEEVIIRLPGLYACEIDVPTRFTQCKTFLEGSGRCVRLLAWLANFHRPYPMLGIPDRLPSNLKEYETLCSQCDGRDFSFVSIRDARRVEFRSACSQPTVDDVLELIRFRWESYQSAMDQPSLDLDTIRAEFVEACRTGRSSLVSE